MKDFYIEELKAFSDVGLRYLLIGGVAMGLHGYPRATFDLDIIIALDEENIDKLIVVMKNLGYSPRVPVNPEDLKSASKREVWFKEKNLKAFSFVGGSKLANVVDILIYSQLDFEESYKERKNIKIDDFIVNLASLKDMIRLKEDAGREIDIVDLAVLKELKNSE